MVAIIRLYIAWERSLVQYATTNKKNQRTKKTQKTKNQKNKKNKNKNKHSSLLHHRTIGTRHPLPPQGTLVLPHIIYDYLILYVYTLSRCSRSRHHSFLFFVFGFLVFVFFWGGGTSHIVLNFSLKLCTTWWWPPLWPKHVVVSYLPPYSYIIIIII